MNNTTRVDAVKRIAMVMAAATMVAAAVSYPAAAQPSAGRAQPAANTAQTLSEKQQAIAPIAAATAVGDMSKLNQALNLPPPRRASRIGGRRARVAGRPSRTRAANRAASPTRSPRC